MNLQWDALAHTTAAPAVGACVCLCVCVPVWVCACAHVCERVCAPGSACIDSVPAGHSRRGARRLPHPSLFFAFTLAPCVSSTATSAV